MNATTSLTMPKVRFPTSGRMPDFLKQLPTPPDYPIVGNAPSPADAAAFLRAHPVSYPSYRDSSPGLRSPLPGGFEGLPTTIFIGRTGRLSDVHTGQYDAQGSLDADIKSYALGAG